MIKKIMYKMARDFTRDYSYRKKERWKKGIKYVALFSIVTILLGTGLAIWGSVKAIHHISQSVQKQLAEEELWKSRDTLRAVVSKPITTKECLDTMGSMFSPNKLLTVPITQNIKTIKVACWERSQPPSYIQSES